MGANPSRAQQLQQQQLQQQQQMEAFVRFMGAQTQGSFGETAAPMFNNFGAGPPGPLQDMMAFMAATTTASGSPQHFQFHQEQHFAFPPNMGLPRGGQDWGYGGAAGPHPFLPPSAFEEGQFQGNPFLAPPFGMGGPGGPLPPRHPSREQQQAERLRLKQEMRRRELSNLPPPKDLKETMARYFQLYEDWVVENAPTVSSIESSLNGLIFLLPASTSHVLLTELTYFAIGLYTWVNDLILIRKMEQLRPKLEALRSKNSGTSSGLLPQLPPSSTLAITKWLALLRHLELPAEMYALSADRASNVPAHVAGPKWKLIVFTIELVKAILRVVLLLRIQRSRQGHLLVHQSLPSREEFWNERLLIDELEDEETRSASSATATSKASSASTSTTSTSKRALRPTLLQRTVANGRGGASSTGSRSGLPFDIRTLGELLWIARPLVYLGLIFRHGKQSWTPWIVSLLVDLLSHYCSSSEPKALPSSSSSPSSRRSSSSSSSAFFSPTSRSTPVEQDELVRRLGLWLLYLLRSPFVEAVRSSSIVSRGTSLPVISSITSFAGRLLDSYRQFYFYISGT